MKLGNDALDSLMPMHLQVSPTGHIVHAGPCAKKLRGRDELVGARLLEVFELRNPRSIQSIADLRLCAGRRLKLRFRAAPRTSFKGVLTLTEDGDGLLINLSFGISVIEAIRDYDLHAADFAATDLSVELLYLMEAKSAAMNESRALNRHLQAAKIAAEEQAFTDTLTGLKNRRALTHVLERYLNSRRGFSLMQLDLDYFKDVNDRLGHAAGDHVLQHVAEVMVQQTRGDTTLVRAGGDEFILIFPDLLNREQLELIANRLIAHLEEPIPFGTETCRISGSIGIALVPDPSGTSFARVLEEVDKALYVSKRSGRGRATVYGDPGTEADLAESAPPVAQVGARG